jgi:hypothetical protein
MSALETLRALEALRLEGDATAAEISRRLSLFNECPSAGDYCAELDRAEAHVSASLKSAQ